MAEFFRKRTKKEPALKAEKLHLWADKWSPPTGFIGRPPERRGAPSQCDKKAFDQGPGSPVNHRPIPSTMRLIQNGSRTRMQRELNLRPRRPPLPTPSYRLPPPDVSSGQDLLRRDGGWPGQEAVVEAHQVLPLTKPFFSLPYPSVKI